MKLKSTNNPNHKFVMYLGVYKTTGNMFVKKISDWGNIYTHTILRVFIEAYTNYCFSSVKIH